MSSPTIYLAGILITAAIATIIWWLRYKNAVVDLTPPEFPKLSWDPGKVTHSLDDAYDHAIRMAKQSIVWYYAKRNSKRWGGWLLRGGAILTTAFAGLVPVLGSLTANGGKPGIDPQWGTVALGVTGLLIVLDKFGGFTSSWVRFMTAGQRISEALAAFCVDWEASKLAWDRPDPSAAQAQGALEQVKNFLLLVHGTVREETKAWADEFQSAVRLTDQEKVRAGEVNRLGAINVRVTNGEQCAGGWELSIDDGAKRACFGGDASVGNLVPDIHIIRVSGQIQSAVKRAEKAVPVVAGEIAAVSLTLQ